MRVFQHLHPQLLLISLIVSISIVWQGSANAAQLQLTWTDNSSNEDGFKIERRTGTSAYNQIDESQINTTSYTNSNLPEGTSYCYRVRAFNGVGDSAFTNEACGTTTATLTVITTGTGSGAVISSPAGINCGVDCSETYAGNTTATLTAAPAVDSIFTGWAGACTGTGPCILNMNSTKSVTATFNLKTFALTVNKSGTGSGTVTSSPAGINCGADCSETYASNTSVILTATPAADSNFTGWAGACTGTGPCTLSIDTARSVTAAFDEKLTPPAAPSALAVR